MVQQKIEESDDKLVKQLELQSSVKKPNPFLNGLFAQRIPSSLNPLLNKSRAQSIQPSLFTPDKAISESRFHRFIQFQKNG